MHQRFPILSRRLIVLVVLGSLLILAGCGGEAATAVSASESEEFTPASSDSAPSPTTPTSTASVSVTSGTTTSGPSAESASATDPNAADTNAAGTGATDPSATDTGEGASATTPSPTTCVTVPTTVPGEVFCDGYDPNPPTSALDPACPDWATVKVDRPTGGWLGGGGSAGTDLLRRPGTDDLQNYAPLDDYVARALTAAPAGFVLDGSSARANAACVEETVKLAAWTDGPDESSLGVFTMRLTGKLDWFEEGYPPTQFTTEADGTELGWYDGGTVAKVWLVSPDGLLTKVYAYGAHADTRFGWPTTTTIFGTTEQARPLPVTIDDLKALARALNQ